MPYPNTFIVGAAKAGTTSLYAYLAQHPEVYMSPVKEPHFFSKVTPSKEQEHFIPVVNDEKQYLALFNNAKGAKVIGEASPSYLWDLNTAERIFEKSPNARIIIILRDPVERAYSHYLMDVRDGIQKAPFFEAITEDYRKDKKGWGISHLYVELGMYFSQVKQYLDVFGKNKVCVLMFEEFVQDPRKILEYVSVFLEIELERVKNINTEIMHNPYASPRSFLTQTILGNKFVRLRKKIIPKFFRQFVLNRLLLVHGEKPPIDPVASIYLKEIYDIEIEKLELLLGKKILC